MLTPVIFSCSSESGWSHVSAIASTCVLLAVGIVTAAGASAGNSSTSESAPPPKVSIALTGRDAIFADVILAQELGYFADAKVDVELLNQEAAGVVNAAAGRVDLVGSGTPGSLPPAVNGRQTSIVYNFITGNGDSGLVIPANSPMNEIMQLAGKRVIVKGAGSGSYGAVKRWSAYIESKGGQPLVLVPVQSTAAMNAELVSGQVQAGGGSLTQYTTPLVQGKVKLLVSPSSELAYSVFPQTMAGNVYWGLKSKLQENKVGIERTLSAIRRADEYIHAHTIAEVSAELEKSSYLSGLPASEVEAGVTVDKPFYAKTLGSIPPEAWTATLGAFKYFGLTVPLDSPAIQYGAIVDMSYLDAAPK